MFFLLLFPKLSFSSGQLPFKWQKFERYHNICQRTLYHYRNIFKLQSIVGLKCQVVSEVDASSPKGGWERWIVRKIVLFITKLTAKITKKKRWQEEGSSIPSDDVILQKSSNLEEYQRRLGFLDIMGPFRNMFQVICWVAQKTQCIQMILSNHTIYSTCRRVKI